MQVSIPSKLENQKLYFNNDDKQIENVTVYGVHEIPQEFIGDFKTGNTHRFLGGSVYLGIGQEYSVNILLHIENEAGEKVTDGWGDEWLTETKKRSEV